MNEETMLDQQLLEKIENRTAKVGVVGLGYVGLPLVVAYAEAGFEVIGIDVDIEKIKLLHQGESYVEDISNEELAVHVESGRFVATDDYSALDECDAISICVPTPLRKTKDPDISYIVYAAEKISELNYVGKLIVLESTTYPGTTDEVILPMLVTESLEVGQDFFLAFSPERIDPGRTDYTLKTTPKVIGGTTEVCTKVAVALYSSFVEQPVPVASTAAAEMVKLLENTFRAVNIGLVNEMALMCNKLGLDVWEVVGAAATKPYGFMPFYPGPGLGGHCIPIDPHYLSWKLRTLNYTARFIELASEINSSMPEYVIHRINDALNDDGKPIRGSRVLIIGVAYKPNVSDVRESPALDIIHLLADRGAQVVYADPFVPTLMHEGFDYNAELLSPELLKHADCVVIVTNHKRFDWEMIATHASLVIDTRNSMSKSVDNLDEYNVRVIGLS